MTEYIPYLLKAVACSAVMYLFYRLVLDKRASFGFCRAYLIASVIISAAVPVLNIPVYSPDVVHYTPVYISVDPELPPLLITDTETGKPISAESIYAAIALLLLCITARHALMIAGYRKRSEKTVAGRCNIYKSDRIESPFSFFRNIFIPRGLGGEELHHILCHELSHIRHGHSAELMAIEILKSLLWFNPFVWIVRRRLKDLHEFQADHDVIEAGADPVNYQHLVFRQVFGHSPEIASGMADSRMKKRLVMISSTENYKKNLFRSLTAVPLAAMLTALFGFTQKDTVYVADTAAGFALQADSITFYGDTMQRVIKEGVRVFDNMDDAKEFLREYNADRDANRAPDPAPLSNSKQTLAGEGTALIYTPPANELKNPFDRPMRSSVKGNGAKKPVLYVDGQRRDEEYVQTIDPAQIESVSVVTDESMMKEYGYSGGGEGLIIVMKRIQTDADGTQPAPGSGKQPQKTGPDTNKKLIGSADDTEHTKSDLKKEVAGNWKNRRDYEKAVFVINGMERDYKAFEEIDPAEIAELTLLSAESAMAIYGEKGRNGAVIVTVKNKILSMQQESLSGSRAAISLQEALLSEERASIAGQTASISQKNSFIRLKKSISDDSDPLVLVDGKPAGKDELSRISPDNVENITILKDSSATAVFGVRGQNGVILLTTKQAQTYKGVPDAETKHVPTKHTANQADDLVVVGYGSVKKSKAKSNNRISVETKSGMSIKASGVTMHLSDTISLSVEQDNLTLKYNPKIPFGESAPVIIIDGETCDSMNHISPQEIESITVLRHDDTAVKIFGGKARNGVIVIKTKDAPEKSVDPS